MFLEKPFTAAMLIPTGLGASQGGYGGDASVWLNLIASVCDRLITHPNVANAAAFQSLPDNALYVEGYGLDQFFQGHWALRPVRKQRIGVLLDAAIEPGMKTLHRNTIDAVRQVYGVDICAVEESSEPIEHRLIQDSSGASTGELLNPELLIQAAQHLQEKGATAIALCTRIQEPEGSTYSQGLGADPIGGLEAILSHSLVHALSIPCANAPVFDWQEAQPRRDERVDPRTAAEYITATFLPCVLQGLHQAPDFIPQQGAECPWDLRLEDLDALIVPADALGALPVLACLDRRIPVIAVESNQTVLNVDKAALLGACSESNAIYSVQSYLEVVGLLKAMRLGVSLPA